MQTPEEQTTRRSTRRALTEIPTHLGIVSVTDHDGKFYLLFMYFMFSRMWLNNHLCQEEDRWTTIFKIHFLAAQSTSSRELHLQQFPLRSWAHLHHQMRWSLDNVVDVVYQWFLVQTSMNWKGYEYVYHWFSFFKINFISTSKSKSLISFWARRIVLQVRKIELLWSNPAVLR